MALSAVLAGIWPAIRMTRVRSRAGVPSWTDHRPDTGGTRPLNALGPLRVAQVALSATLLVGGMLVMRSFTNVLRTDLGFDSSSLLTFRVAFPAGRYQRESLEVFSYQVTEQLRGVPGVRDAAYSWHLPLVQARAGARMSTRPTRPGVSAADDSDRESVSTGNMWMHHDRLRAMGLPVVQGRPLAEQDDADHPRVVVANEALVRSGVLGDRPVGRVVYFGDAGSGLRSRALLVWDRTSSPGRSTRPSRLLVRPERRSPALTATRRS